MGRQPDQGRQERLGTAADRGIDGRPDHGPRDLVAEELTQTLAAIASVEERELGPNLGISGVDDVDGCVLTRPHAGG